MENNHPLLGFGEHFGSQHKTTPHLEKKEESQSGDHYSYRPSLLSFLVSAMYALYSITSPQIGGMVYLTTTFCLSRTTSIKTSFIVFSSLCCYFYISTENHSTGGKHVVHEYLQNSTFSEAGWLHSLTEITRIDYILSDIPQPRGISLSGFLSCRAHQCGAELTPDQRRSPVWSIHPANHAMNIHKTVATVCTIRATGLEIYHRETGVGWG